MTRPFVPQPVLDLAHARAAARAARDWATADDLRARIEAAGWRVVDAGTDFALEPASPPDAEIDGIVAYGTSGAVPSRLDEASTGTATVILIATDAPSDLERAVRGLVEHAPAGTEIVVVADGPSPELAERLGSLPDGIVVVRTSARLGSGAAMNVGIRRAGAPLVVLMDTSVEPTGDIISPLVEALETPDVAVAGPFGLRSADLRRFEETLARGAAAAIEGYAMAFRRSDAAGRGPVDEHFHFYRNLDIWWSLVLRDEGLKAPPRLAVVVADLPLVRHEHRAWTSLPVAERDRLSRRNFYRVLDRFRDRSDLAVPAAGT